MTQNIANDIASGLGAFLWWDLYDSTITPEDLRKILTEEGETGIVVPDIDETAAVRRAVREYRKGRGKADRFRAEVCDENGTIKIGILTRKQVSVSEVAWEQVDSIEYKAGTFNLWIDGGKTAEAWEVVALANKRRKYLDHGFIRPAILVDSLSKMGAFSLRRKGGCYYVPIQHMETLERLQRIVERIGNCQLNYTHVSDTVAGRKALGREARGTLESELKNVMEQLDQWTESSRKIRTDSESTMLATFADIRSRASLYSDALSVSLSGIEEKVAAAEQRARDIIQGKEKETS